MPIDACAEKPEQQESLHWIKEIEAEETGAATRREWR
jgi:hypothetical protein